MKAYIIWELAPYSENTTAAEINTVFIDAALANEEKEKLEAAQERLHPVYHGERIIYGLSVHEVRS